LAALSVQPPKPRRLRIRVEPGKICVVETIKEITADLELESLHYVEIPAQAEIDVDQPGRPKRIASGVAGPDSGAHRIHRHGSECGAVQILQRLTGVFADWIAAEALGAR